MIKAVTRNLGLFLFLAPPSSQEIWRSAAITSSSGGERHLQSTDTFPWALNALQYFQYIHSTGNVSAWLQNLMLSDLVE